MSIVVFCMMNDFSGRTADYRFFGQSLPAGSVPVRIVQLAYPSWGKDRVWVDLVWLDGAMKAAVDRQTAEAMLSVEGELSTGDIRFIADNLPECVHVAHQWDNHWSMWANDLVSRLVEAGADINFVRNGKTVLDFIYKIVEDGGSGHDDEGPWPWETYVIPAFVAIGAKRASEL